MFIKSPILYRFCTSYKLLFSQKNDKIMPSNIIRPPITLIAVHFYNMEVHLFGLVEMEFLCVT